MSVPPWLLLPDQPTPTQHPCLGYLPTGRALPLQSSVCPCFRSVLRAHISKLPYECHGLNSVHTCAIRFSHSYCFPPYPQLNRAVFFFFFGECCFDCLMIQTEQTRTLPVFVNGNENLKSAQLTLVYNSNHQ